MRLGFGSTRQRDELATIASPAEEQEAKATALFLRSDTDAAALINIYNFSWRQLAKWVNERQRQMGSDFARHGGVERLKKAIRILKEGSFEYLLFESINRSHNEDRQRELVCMMLAKAAGVMEVSVVYDGILHEQFIGEGTIPFPNGVLVTAKGAGYNPEPDVDPLFRKTIIYTLRPSI